MEPLTGDLELDPPLDDDLFVGSDPAGAPPGEGRVFPEPPPGVGVVVGGDDEEVDGEEVDVVAQAAPTPQKVAPSTHLEIARDMHRSLIANPEWRKENPRAVEWGVYQNLIDGERVTPKAVIEDFAREHNKGLKISELFHSIYWSTPENIYRTDGISRRRSAEQETLYQIAEVAGVPLSFVKEQLAQGVNANTLIANLTGAEDVEDLFDDLERAGEDAGRRLVEGAPAAAVAMEAAGATFAATAPLRAGGLPGTIGSLLLSAGAGGVGGWFGWSFMNRPRRMNQSIADELLGGPSPEVTPRALPARHAGQTFANMALFTRPLSRTLGTIPENIGAARVITNLDRMNMPAIKRIMSYVFPGFKRGAQNFAEQMGIHARRKVTMPFTKGRLKFAAGVPMNISDIIAGGSMALGAGVAEQLDPGDVMTRIEAELGLTMVNPLRMGMKLVFTALPAAVGAMRSVGRMKTGYGPKEQEKAYNWLLDYAEQMGFPEDVVHAEMNRQGPWGLRELPGDRTLAGARVSKTMSQLTGLPPFHFLERNLGKERVSEATAARLEALGVRNAMGGPTLRQVIKDGEEAGINAIVEFMVLMRNMGSPEALKVATQLERAIIEDVFQTSVQKQINRASEAAGRLGAREGDSSVMNESGKIYETIVTGMRDARALESQKYDAAGEALTRPVEANSVVAMWNKLTRDPGEVGEGTIPEFLARYSGSSPIAKWIKRKTEGEGEGAVEELAANAARRIQVENRGIATADAAIDTRMNNSPEAVAALEDALGIEASEIRTLSDAIGETAGGLPVRDHWIGKLQDVISNYGGPVDEYVIGSYLGSRGRKEVVALAKQIINKLSSKGRLEQARAELVTARDALPAGSREITELFTNVGELKSFRSEMLSLMRESNAAGKWTESAYYDALQKAALEDMGLAVGRRLDDGTIDTTEALDDEALEALREAYNFSADFNNVYSRMFSAEVLKKTRQGGQAQAPELLAALIFGPQSDPTTLKVRELFEAARFVGAAGPKAALERGSTLAGSFDTILRKYSEDVLVPIKGSDGAHVKNRMGDYLYTVDPEKRRTFLKKYGEAIDASGLGELNRLLREDLEGITAQEIKALTNKSGPYYKGLQDQAKYAAFWGSTAGNKQGALAGVVPEDPSTAISGILSSETPAASLAKLAESVKEGKIVIHPGPGMTPVIQTLDGTSHEAAKLGFRDAVLDVVMQRAGIVAASERMGARGDPDRLFQELYKPLRKGSTASIMSILHGAGIIDTGFRARLRTMIRSWQDLKKVSETASELQETVGRGTSALEELGLSLLGSELGSSVARGVGRGTLIFQAKSSAFAHKMFSKMPNMMLRKAAVDMLADPPLFQAMRRKGRIPPSQMNKISEFFARYWSSAAFPVAVKEYAEEFEADSRRRSIEAAKKAGATRQQLELMWPEIKSEYPAPRPPRRPPRKTAGRASPILAAAPPVAAPPEAAPSIQTGGPSGGLAYQDVFPRDSISPLLEARQGRQQLAATQGIGSLA